MVIKGYLLPQKVNILGAGTGEVVCTKFTGDENIFSIAQITAESLIDQISVESDGIG